MKGSSTLIEGLSGDESRNSTRGIANVATDVLVGATRTSGDILEKQPAIADTGKGIAADVVSIGSRIAGEVSNRPELIEGGNDIRKTIQNVFQGLFG